MDPKTDGRNRAWRTLVQGLLTDVLAAVVMVAIPEISGTDFAWSGTFWLALAALAGKSALMAFVSYIGRQVLPPASLFPTREPVE